MEKTVDIFILLILGVIFLTDAGFDIYFNDTISKHISDWIQKSKRHLVIFLGVVALLCIHWIFGNYK